MLSKNQNYCCLYLDHVNHNTISFHKTLVLRLCTGALKSTPTDALRVEAKERPLNLRRELLSLKFLFKLRSEGVSRILIPLGQLSSLTLISSY